MKLCPEYEDSLLCESIWRSSHQRIANTITGLTRARESGCRSERPLPHDSGNLLRRMILVQFGDRIVKGRRCPETAGDGCCSRDPWPDSYSLRGLHTQVGIDVVAARRANAI